MATSRVPELDGLRALAVLSVFAFHFTLGDAWANPVTGFGWAGVDLFFVLSGYLITSILLADRGRPGYFRRFYARRARRIFPVFYLVLGLGLAAAFILHRAQPWSYWVMQAAFLSATLQFFHYWPVPAPQPVLAGLVVVWSLSVEEQFYLLWAPLVRWARGRALPFVIAAIVVAAPLLRWRIHRVWFPEYAFFPARLDTLAWGAALALALRAGAGRRALRCWALGGGMALALVCCATGGARSSRLFAAFGYSALAAACAGVVGLVVLGAASSSRAWRWLGWQPLPAVGRISYGMYLVHFQVLSLVRDYLPLRLPAALAVSLGATLALAGLSWRFIESPLLAAREPAPSVLRTRTAVAASL